MDALLLQHQQQPAAAGSRNSAAPSGSSSSIAAPTFRVLVLATTSRPEQLDDAMTARLGASDCLLAVSVGVEIAQLTLGSDIGYAWTQDAS